MSNFSIEMRVPLDREGFLRRECPNCEQQFKLHQTDSSSETPENTDIESYFCPYCYEPAPQNSWWTKEQLEYAQQLAFKEVVEPEIRNLQRQIQSINRNGSFVQINSTLPHSLEPNLSSEMDEMDRVKFPCHPEKPVKIDCTWEQDVACFVCGIQYPVSLIKELRT